MSRASVEPALASVCGTGPSLRCSPLAVLALVAAAAGIAPAQGQQFGAPFPLDVNAGSDAGADTTPQLATDGAGTWVAAWTSTDSLGGTIGGDLDILYARSTDNGVTWSPPMPLNTNAATDSGADLLARVVADGSGTWVAAWESGNSLGGTIGTDFDVLFARSTDGGLTWSSPAPLNSNAFGDVATDREVQVTTDGAGTWIAVWESNDSLGGSIGTDRDVLYARSTDGGMSWSAALPLNGNASLDSGADVTPQITTEGAGTWLVLWDSNDPFGGTLGADRDLLVSRSTDAGLSWSFPVPLVAAASTDAGNDFAAQLTTDRAGTWVAVWQSTDSLGGTAGSDFDILVAQSLDGGLTWTGPVLLNSNGDSDSGNDFDPQLVTDELGRWFAVWASDDTLGGTLGADEDLLASRSSNKGLTWDLPAPLLAAATDSGDDLKPQVATDGAGHWVAVWESTDDLGGAIGPDRDILVAVATLRVPPARPRPAPPLSGVTRVLAAAMLCAVAVSALRRSGRISAAAGRRNPR